MAGLWTILAGGVLYGNGPSDPRVEFFEKRVRPILAGSCYACHSAETKPAGGLRVDDRNGLLTGGNSGPAVLSGEPDKSLLLDRIRTKDAKKHMPKEGSPLSETQVADLEKWIRDGVAWPAEVLPASPGHLKSMYEGLRQKHWSLQPVTDPKAPAVKNAAWARSEIDRFVLARLEAKGLAPVADADRVTLIRRLTFDLTGLPPTPGEIDAFVADRRADAYERLVDRLLASPGYGERWGRHWLDVARYAESTGPSRNVPYPHAWKYRDYVLRSVAEDVPFDRFLREQIAGDLLPAADDAARDRQRIATGFLALGPKDVNQRFKERFVMDNVDEQIDTLTRSTLALTVSCARCHDHKFDAIPRDDYYALAGIFTSTVQAAGVRNKMGGSGLDYYDPKGLLTMGAGAAPAADPAQVAALEAKVAEARKEWDAIRGTPRGLAPAADGRPTQRPYRLRLEALETELLTLTDPAEKGLAAHGLRDGAAADTAIRIRGEAERLGPVVPRGFLSAVTVAGARPVNRDASGRLELAEWVSSPANPLTARVAVNRAWHHLFGQGLVRTVDNFGVSGDRPSHPELLDYLAHRFTADGWSVKRLIRTIVLTHTYQLGGAATAAHREADPANRLLWRHAPRRADAEELRDAMLASAGRLDGHAAAGSPAQKLRMIEMPDNGPESRNMHRQADESRLRSVYLPLLRGVTPSALAAFDPVTQTLVTGQRESTTVPTQALFLLNSVFVREQARALAGRLLAEQWPGGEPGRIRQAYRLTLGRDPSAAETARAREFLAAMAAQAPVAAAGPVIVPTAATAPRKTDRVDQVDQTDAERNAAVTAAGTVVEARSAAEAAWMSLAQALYASAEFRFVR